MTHSGRSLLLTLALLGGCAEPPPSATVPPAATGASIDEFFQRFTDEWARRDPNFAIGARYFDGDEQDRLNREITPVSHEYELQRIRFARDGLAELATFDRDALSSEPARVGRHHAVATRERRRRRAVPRLRLPAGADEWLQRQRAESVHRRAAGCDAARCGKLRRAARPNRRAHGRGRCGKRAARGGGRAAAASSF